ncbi:MAG: c-type cytochrome [Bacteroidota bacterium]|jgi:mono/diheme cytochrome c family protein
MRYYALFFLISLLLISCGGNESDQQAQVQKQEPKQIYLQKCASCHGEQGNLTLGGARKIVDTQLTKDQISQQIAEGKGSMPRFSDRLSKEEIEGLSEYCLQLAGK